MNSRIKDASHRTSTAVPVGPDGQPTSFLAPGAQQVFLFNPQPVYPIDWGGWGPRIAVDYAATKRTVWHAGAAITTLLPNLWLDNYVTGGFPLVFQPLVTALPGTPVPFSNTAVPLALPTVCNTAGQLLFPGNNPSRVPANTAIDVQRFQNDVEALTPGHEPQLIVAAIISRHFLNGYIGTYTLGMDHDFGFATLNASYVGTAGVHLANIFDPNGYAGADPSFAPFTEFNSAGHAIGGYGPEAVMRSGAHSSCNALQTSLSKNDARLGLEFQASYTFSKSIDNTSTLLGGLPTNAGVTVQAMPQNPRDLKAERGPSTFDVTHVFSVSLIQMLPLDRLDFLKPLGKKVTGGWQILNVTSLQTGAGAGGTDRPNLIAKPDFSTSRTVREDYFGRGANNGSFLLDSDSRSRRQRPQSGPFRNTGARRVPGAGIPSIRHRPYQEHPVWPTWKWRVGRAAISRGIFQYF